MKIIYAPHRSHKRELEFANALIARFPHAEHVKRTPRVELEYLDIMISSAELKGHLCSDNMLTPKRRDKALRDLPSLPSEVKVAETLKKISCDIAIEHKGETYYYEFHEQQHRTLSVLRRSPVYNADNERFDVPRYLQRLVRDVWRVKALRNFTIVWFDWFAVNKDIFCMELEPDFREYSLSGAFSFKHFCKDKSPGLPSKGSQLDKFEQVSTLR